MRSGVTKVKLSDELGSEVWPRLKAFVMKQNKPASSNVLYMCKYCKLCPQWVGNCTIAN